MVIYLCFRKQKMLQIAPHTSSSIRCRVAHQALKYCWFYGARRISLHSYLLHIFWCDGIFVDREFLSESKKMWFVVMAVFFVFRFSTFSTIWHHISLAYFSHPQSLYVAVFFDFFFKFLARFSLIEMVQWNFGRRICTPCRIKSLPLQFTSRRFKFLLHASFVCVCRVIYRSSSLQALLGKRLFAAIRDSSGLLKIAFKLQRTAATEYHIIVIIIAIKSMPITVTHISHILPYVRSRTGYT